MPYRKPHPNLTLSLLSENLPQQFQPYPETLFSHLTFHCCFHFFSTSGQLFGSLCFEFHKQVFRQCCKLGIGSFKIFLFRLCNLLLMPMQYASPHPCMDQTLADVPHLLKCCLSNAILTSGHLSRKLFDGFLRFSMVIFQGFMRLVYLLMRPQRSIMRRFRLLMGRF